jgi:hypothetical protein
MGVAWAEEIPDGCGDNDEFTQDFRIGDCEFKTKGINPYLILMPGYQLVLESEEEEGEFERSVETVLYETKEINLDGRKILTRVVEERAIEVEVDEEGEEDETVVEISLNYVAICKETNAVYYFGELSRDCENGFTDDELMCEPEEEDGEPTEPDTAGSWEAGVNGAKPGLLMPGTFLLGAKYFQEIAPPDAVDRGENVAMGLTAEDPKGGPDFTECVNIIDTNPAEEPPVCEDEDSKIYCPGIGIVQDEDLELVDYGFVECDDEDECDDDSDSDSDEDSDSDDDSDSDGGKDPVSRFVRRFYKHCLDRDPDEGGLLGWVDDLKTKNKTGAHVARGFIFSREFIEKKTSDGIFLKILYKAFFDRDADEAGKNGWMKAIEEGRSREHILDGFLFSEEFKKLSSQYGIKAN